MQVITQESQEKKNTKSIHNMTATKPEEVATVGIAQCYVYWITVSDKTSINATESRTGLGSATPGWR